MFFVLPSLLKLCIYLLAAVLPAAFLLRYIYKKDTVEKEPPRLLILLLLSGVGAALVSIVLERLGMDILNAVLYAESPFYTVAMAFLVVAVVEEGTKLLLLRLCSWRSPAFNYSFDGVVFAVFVSLGFAAFENIIYVFSYGLSVALPRALLSIPGHMGFAVFMGVFYGRAKLMFNYGQPRRGRANLRAAYLIAVFLHGFYDACAMKGGTVSTLLFIVFVVVMYVVTIRLIRRQSAGDERID